MENKPLQDSHHACTALTLISTEEDRTATAGHALLNRLRSLHAPYRRVLRSSSTVGDRLQRALVHFAYEDLTRVDAGQSAARASTRRSR